MPYNSCISDRPKGKILNLSTLDDAALIAAIAGLHGARQAAHRLNEAVGILYDRYGRLVYTIAIHTVGDSETAEEITQDVFVRACEGAQSYRPEMAKVSSWLVSITRHRAIDELRRRSSRADKHQVDWPEDIGLENMPGMQLLDGPETAVESSLQSKNIRQAIASLPQDQRQALGLAFYKGLSHSEIAAMLGEPLGTVKSRIRMAMQKLRELMVERNLIEL
jgi:RNA polymerase sigma-70 factor, ECF subfamily